MLAAGCGADSWTGADGIAAADRVTAPERGRALIRAYGCGSCHTIPGVVGARGRVGPPLDGMGERAYIAGIVANTPEQMIVWIQDPTIVDTRTAMPRVGVTNDEARDITAYLFSLRARRSVL